MTNPDGALDASFRDPCGFVFLKEGILYRQVNVSYQPHYDKLHQSGLYDYLTAAGQLVRHDEVDPGSVGAMGACRVIRPRRVPFISYPYEWCFSALKDAALATLDIQLAALERGMTLKDASAYNIQFLDGRPVMIDTLSFENRQAGAAWTGYRQFCQHFLAPLALMSRVDVRLNQLLCRFIDGVPLDLASRLLPRRTRLRPALLMHIHLHAASQRRHAGASKPAGRRVPQISERGIQGIVSGLRSAVAGMTWKPPRTEWGDYYDHTNYSDAAADHKADAVLSMIETVRPGSVWDLGANTGRYSRLAAATGASVLAFDVDPAAVEASYQHMKDNREANLLPLLQDLTNPSPGIGWHNRERGPIESRGRPDLLLALALIHHLAISNNVPLERIASYLREMGGALAIEFVPKSDSQVRRLLATREDIFPDYEQATFERVFARYYRIERSVDIPETHRILYLMRPV